MNTTLQIRVDKNTKKQAQKVFKDMGLDMSSGVKLFLQRVVNTETLPFEVVTKNGYTRAQERTMLKETKQALKKSKSYKSAHSLHKDILGA
ncbi:MAG: type II toxin-antitoxin system RelB/DinJ family antitoxin [Candidatus Pacebacteria bacterium]|nr:type II toxin-antitoxin system RelB/DinJ family antitoxin [Candidatus Paceibacterota bacterium]